MNLFLLILISICTIIFIILLLKSKRPTVNNSELCAKYAETAEYQEILIKIDSFNNELREKHKNPDINELIDFCQSKLKSIPTTPYHIILNSGLFHQEKELTEWIIQFYHKAKKEIDLKAIYFEVNGFSINTNKWFVDGFGLIRNLNHFHDSDYLADWDFVNQREDIFTIRGYEELQNVFSQHFNDKMENMKYEYAETICEYLIILRIQELFSKAYKQAQIEEPQLNDIPIIIDAHDYEFELIVK